MALKASQDWQLLWESADRTGGQGVPPFKKLEIPAAGPSYLLQSSARGPQILDVVPSSGEDFFVLEPVAIGHQPYLLMLSPCDVRARVNDQAAPAVMLLGVKDQVQLSPEHVLHVTQYARPAIGEPPEEFVGKECPVCRLPFEPDTRVYLCPACGKPTHCEGEEKPADKRLECIRFGTECPTCTSPVVLAQGYTYVPEV